MGSKRLICNPECLEGHVTFATSILAHCEGISFKEKSQVNSGTQESLLISVCSWDNLYKGNPNVKLHQKLLLPNHLFSWSSGTGAWLN